MATTPITLTKRDASTTVAFSLQSLSGNKASYIAASSSLAEPLMLEVSHEIKPAGATSNDRHFVTVRQSKLNDQGKVKSSACTIQWSVARDTVFTDTEVEDLLAMAISYYHAITAASLTGRDTAIIDGITP